MSDRSVHLRGKRKHGYEVVEISLADTRRLLGYKRLAKPDIHLNLKGFDCAWIINAIPAQAGLRVLDVGAGYSWLPSYLAKEKGCEVWAVDDFGYSEADPFWTRSMDPAEHIRAHPEIKYVLGRLGTGPAPDLPAGYFDCIYSASALEHVPPGHFSRVWADMDSLLRPGGTMLHALDIAFPTSRGLPHVVMAAGFDLVHPILPSSLRNRFLFETPQSCARAALRALGCPERNAGGRVGIVRMVLDPEVVTEPLDFTLNRLMKDGDERIRHFRVGSLLIHLVKH